MCTENFLHVLVVVPNTESSHATTTVAPAAAAKEGWYKVLAACVAYISHIVSSDVRNVPNFGIRQAGSQPRLYDTQKLSRLVDDLLRRADRFSFR